MSINVLQAARYLVEQSNGTLSNLELQKRIYIAHMFHLGRHGHPLVAGLFEAWDYGPVHPNLYHAVKHFGADPVTELTYPLSVGDGTEKDLLDEALGSLSGRSGGQLIAITHWENGAWAKNYIPGNRHVPIPNADILEEYNKRAKGA